MGQAARTGIALERMSVGPRLGTGDQVNHKSTAPTRARHDRVDRWSVETAIIPPRTALRGHGHSEAHLCLVREGGFVERWAGRDHVCGPGTLRLSRPQVEHQIDTQASAASCLVIEFPESLLLGHHALLQLDHDPSRFFETPRWMRRRAASLSAASSDDLALECWMAELLAQIARQTRSSAYGRPPAWLTRVRDRLEEEFREPVTLVELSQFAGVHPSHLARAFREHYGCTVGDLTRNRRLRFARRQIENTNDPIAEIALEAGFADQAHLTRCFSQRWGHPPARFRRQSRPRTQNANPVQDREADPSPVS